MSTNTPSGTLPEVAAPGAVQDAKPVWALQSKVLELPCADPPPASGDWLGRGRELGNEQRWGDAVAAFEAAIAARSHDPAALSELSWAALKAGDYPKAVDAGTRAAQLATKPAQKAGALYNLGRAAEALGNLEQARASYRESLALRPSDAVAKRLDAVGASAATRVLKRSVPGGNCQRVPSLESMCACMTRALAKAGASVTGELECEATEHQTATARIIEVRGKTEDDDPRVAPGMYYILAAKGGNGAWSVLATVEAISDTDLELTPRGGNAGSIEAIDERVLSDGRLLWVQSTDRFADSGMGEETVTEHSTLTLCKIPDDSSQKPYCYSPVSLGEIEYIHGAAPGEDERCEVLGSPSIFSASLDSSGVLQLVLVRGKDATGRAGIYRL